MRRKDRALSEQDALEIIDKSQYATIACTDGEEVFAVPISIVRDGNSIYIHGAPAGSKERLLRDGKEVVIVCVSYAQVPNFSDKEVAQMVADGKASSVFTTEYRSAIAKTRAYQVADEDTKAHVLCLLSEKYTPQYMDAFKAALEQSLTRTNVYEFQIVSVSAKAKII